MPNSLWCFIVGLSSGLFFYFVLYLLDRLDWPLQRLLGILAGGKLGASLYVAMYVLFLWGIVIIIWKSKLARYEYKSLLMLEQKFPSSRIISKRGEIESLKAIVSHGTEGLRLRNTAVGQILMFLLDHCLVVETSERIVEIFTRRMDTLQKQVEASYDMLRYIAWAIPSIGFIGTVMGIGTAVLQAGLEMDDIQKVTQPLGLAFDTTLIALLESVVLMFLIHSMQHKEQNLLNAIDLFCQEKFIINLRLE